METDPLDQPVFTAQDVLAYRRGRGLLPDFAPPETVVVCYARGLMTHAARRYRARRVGGFAAELLLLEETAGRVAVAGNFGVGGPATAGVVEELAALGARRFVIVGSAGGLQPDLHPGDLLVAERAVRAEGVSRHYLPPASDVAADPDLAEALGRALNSHGLAYRSGVTWTTDAPYREIRRDVLRHQQAGVLAVEMEAASLFAVGRALGVAAGAVLVVFDILSDGRWQLGQDLRPVEQSLRAALEAVIACRH